MIAEYLAVFIPEKSGGYSVLFPSLPGCYTQGETFEEAQRMAKEALELWLETTDDTGEYFETGNAITARIEARVRPMRKTRATRTKSYARTQRARR